VEVEDPELVDVIRQCEAIPGYELFKYFDDNGDKQTITSADVNQYLQDLCSGEAVTAKYFRTWAGTVNAVEFLRELPATNNPKQAEQNVVDMVKTVAVRLGNTPSVCRACYIHPHVIDIYLAGKLTAIPAVSAKPFFSTVEAFTLELLQQVLQEPA
jgi:DNA topoisomerase-1